MIKIYFRSPLPDLLIKILEAFSDHEVAGRTILLGTRGQVLYFNNLVQYREKLEERFWDTRPE